MTKYGRSRKEVKQDFAVAVDAMAENEPSPNAKKWMQRKPYSTESALAYLRRKGVDSNEQIER